MTTIGGWPAVVAALLPLLVLGCPGCGGLQGRPPPRPDPFPAAYAAGRAEAEADIVRDNPHWLRVPTSGPSAPLTPSDSSNPPNPSIPPEPSKPPVPATAPAVAWDRRSGIDPATGLPWVAADPADPATPGRVAGHNAALDAYIRAYGVPPNPRQQWSAELSDLRGYFAARSAPGVGGAAGRPTELPLDGRALFATEGQFGLAWRRTPKAADPTQLLLIYGLHGGASNPVPPIPATLYGGRTEVLWGPPAGEFAVLHWTAPTAPEGDREGYSALDLRTGYWLKHERVGATP
jgi:hypothetical protein